MGTGTYQFGNVNVITGGSLIFADATIDFWARSILVENGGSLIAGSPTAPIGTQGGVVTIHLYGPEQPAGTGNGDGGQGILCLTDAQCGIPASVWNSNGGSKVALPGGVTDFFYQYQPVLYDDGGTVKGYFGYKVLAVSYGGTLQLFGKKGATYTTVDSSNSGTSWVRLNQTLQPGDTTLALDRAVDWQPGDQIVVTTTDYLPGHSEQLTIASVGAGGTSVTVSQGVKYIHNGQRYDLSAVPARLQLDPALTAAGAETRAAVALLTRSIRIVSAGDALGQAFPAPPSSGPGYFFGGHTDRAPGRAGRADPGRRVLSARAGWAHGALSRPPPPGAADPDEHLRDGLLRARLDDPLVRPARDPRRDARPQRRLPVDRPRLLHRGRDRDRQSPPLQHRDLRAGRRRQSAEPAPGPRHPGLAGHPGRRDGPLPLRLRPPDGVLDHERVERLRIQHGGGSRDVRRLLLAGARGQQRPVAPHAVGVLRLAAGRSQRQQHRSDLPRGPHPLEALHRQLLLLGHELLQHHRQHHAVPRRRLGEPPARPPSPIPSPRPARPPRPTATMPRCRAVGAPPRSATAPRPPPSATAARCPRAPTCRSRTA